MDRMINSAPNYSGLSAYERSEDAVIKMQICEYCEGRGVIDYCSECDKFIDYCGCESLRCLASEKCEDCDGQGEVEL